MFHSFTESCGVKMGLGGEASSVQLFGEKSEIIIFVRENDTV